MKWTDNLNSAPPQKNITNQKPKRLVLCNDIKCMMMQLLSGNYFLGGGGGRNILIV